MNKNVGGIDKVVRIAVAILIAVFMLLLVTTIKIVLIVAAFIALATGILNFFPLYRIIGINTRMHKCADLV